MIPDRPINLQVKRLTLKQQKRFMRLTSTKQDTPEEIDEFECLLAACCDWTYEEIDDLVVTELEHVFAVLKAKGEDVVTDTIPPPSPSSSDTGPPAQPILPPAG